MSDALDSYVIRGVHHNIPLLRDIMTEERFQEGRITTAYLHDVYPDGFQGARLSAHARSTSAALAAIVYAKMQAREGSALVRDFLVQQSASGDQDSRSSYKCSLERLDDDSWTARLDDGTQLQIDGSIDMADPLMSVDVREADGTTSRQQVQTLFKDSTGRVRLQYHGTPLDYRVYPAPIADYLRHMPEPKAEDLSKLVLSPMPGVVKALGVQVGDAVAEGSEVCVIEAMKMQNSLTAPSSGRIKAITCKIGETVDENAVLVELE